jgi:hypothetical protein
LADLNSEGNNHLEAILSISYAWKSDWLWRSIEDNITRKLHIDEQRITWIEEQGFHVLRFWDNEVMQNIEAVKQVIWRTLI